MVSFLSSVLPQSVLLPAKTFFLFADYFKPVNDTYGHAVGDELLKLVAERIKSRLRVSDSAGRIGGDEFVVLLTHLQQIEDAQDVANQILERLNEPFGHL
jgi:diguanylate cyclase (GGDEF)-like protein